MAREGVTYEMVAAVADKMVGDGGNVTIMGVRDALGTGSPNTIHQHLKVWKSMRPQAAAAAYELPAELVNAFGRELAKAAAAARAEVEEQLVEAQLAADHLSNVGETLEAERDDALEALAGMTTERDAATATAAAHATEIQRLVESVDRERRSAEEARLELATAKLKIEALAEKTDELKAHAEGLRQELAEAQAAKQTAAVEVSRLQAMVEAAAKAEAALVAERDFLKQGLKDVEAELAQARTQAEEARKAHRDELSHAQVAHHAELAEAQAKAEAERKAHRDELATAQAALATATAKIEALTEGRASAQAALAEAKRRIEALELAEVEGRKALTTYHQY